MFVLVPGHDCDSPAKVLQCAVGQLAIMICGLHRSWVVDPLLWFKNPVASARQGGPRQAEEVYPHLEIGAAKYPNQRIVLIDDVKTSGGHLRAAKALLSANGLKVQSAICVARTVEQWPDDPFTYAHEELEDFEPDE